MTPCTFESKKKPKNAYRLFELGLPFEKILRSWGAAQINRHPASTAMNYINVERMALLSGTLNGILVVRSTLEFASWLRNQRADTSLGRYDEIEVFEEMVSLYCLYLFHDFWVPQNFHIGPIHPFRSIPADWPLGEPHAYCNFVVEGFPVEIRLWMKD